MLDGGTNITEQTAPPISADFLTGNTQTGLDRIRTRLLDLTNRNKLLNFRHSTASSLRVVDVALDPVFARLRDNAKLPFVPVPEPKLRGGELPPAKDHAEALGWRSSFELDEIGANGMALRTLHYPEALDTLTRKIGSAANTAIEESGTNMLHLVFGFLEWYEADDSKQPHLAPLVVMPVSLERSAAKARAAEATVEYSGEDIETNLSLVEKMRRDFGLEIPTLEDEDTPESYFARFETILELKQRWSIRRQLTLSLLSFGKLLMFRDLDPKTWPSGNSIATHPLVRELFEGTKNAEVSLAEEYPIDAPELRADVPHLIRDADSSQHSALIHALKGQNLVIEGPPGTGKSQTITNLIAAALAKGKTILFVSEKLAALEVVRRRLDEAGLGVFCLEIHSHKTKKGALISDLAQRTAMRGTFKEPRELDHQLGVVDDRKHLLTRYVSLINKNVEPLKATVFEILWARDYCGQRVLPHRDILGGIILTVVVQYSRLHFTRAEQFLAVYAEHLAAVLSACDSLEHHPWAWAALPLGFDQQDELVVLLRALGSNVQRALGLCSNLQTSTEVALTLTPRGLQHASSVRELLPLCEVPLMDKLLVPCQDAATRLKIARFLEQVESYRQGMEVISAATSDTAALLDAPVAEDVGAAYHALHRLCLGDRCLEQVNELRQLITEASDSIDLAGIAFRALMSSVECDAAPTLMNADAVLATLRIAENAPFDVLHLRHPVFENERTRTLLERARQECAAIMQDEETLASDFDLSLGAGEYTAEQLLNSAAVIESSSLLQRLFGDSYRSAVKAYRRIALRKKKPSRQEMSEGLRCVAKHASLRVKFENYPDYRTAFEGHFRGLHTPWDGLHRVALWYERVHVSLPNHRAHTAAFRRLLFDARIDHLRSVKAAAELSDAQRAVLKEALERLRLLAESFPAGAFPPPSASFDELSGFLHKVQEEFDFALRATESATLKGAVLLREVPLLLSAAASCRLAMNHMAADQDLPCILGSAYRAMDTVVEPIQQTLHFAETIASGRLPNKCIQWLLSPHYAGRLAEMRSWLDGAVECGRTIESLTASVNVLSGSGVWATAGPNLGGLLAMSQLALSSLEELPRWIDFLRLQIKSNEDGLGQLTVLADNGTLKPWDLVPAFDFAFYNTLARSVFTAESELAQATGVTQDLLRQQFAAADRQAIRLYSQRVASLIDQRPIPYGNQSGPVRSWTELALIQNEINKQKRHIPIRQLIRRSANALLALKPCFMMGPLSVAQYLAPGLLKFDLVVMDEASQLKPEDAIGALARGGQVVIVGDPKQLPPTSFFQRISLDEEDQIDDEVRTAVEEGESILDVASTLFQPVRRLRWHYRSRHQSLIAFSNEEFYGGDLIIFPSAFHEDPTLGVKYRAVKGGIFENSRNPPEAAAVVEAVLDHMRQYPHESLGVVTLNFEQRELVEELLDKRLREDPAAVDFQERMAAGPEPLFIKNLENVQGDERDVIFISATYGPDARGNQYQRFGPINGPSGHRRLNVLFTRAKKRTVMFSSLDPDLIQTSATSSWGVRALKRYLNFARTGVLQQAREGADQETNDFERSVGAVLKKNGYDVVPQVGVAGFFIDLAVKHPAKPGAFLLGIECDGASYHSGRSARDRDRLRQEILENLGWKIHRIWSTDWFKSREGEIKRLLKRIDDLLAHDTHSDHSSIN